MKRIILTISILAFIFSCGYQERYDKIYGHWECSSWINIPSGMDKCSENVYFKFHEDKTYFSQLGDEADSGAYKLVDDMLYVDPGKRMEFSVRIQKLETDTMVFQMNRGGDEEILTLTKKE